MLTAENERKPQDISWVYFTMGLSCVSYHLKFRHTAATFRHGFAFLSQRTALKTSHFKRDVKHLFSLIPVLSHGCTKRPLSYSGKLGFLIRGENVPC